MLYEVITSVAVGGRTFTLEDVRDVPGPNYIATRGAVTAGDLALAPEIRTYETPPQTTRNNFV